MTQDGRTARQALGAYGERVAAQHLEAAGLQVLDRNWRCPEGELDLVLREGAVLVVCEVKTRTGEDGAGPHEAITPVKLERLQRLAERGVRVPEQLSVVGFDDVFGADFCHPPLTTLAERTTEAGTRAVEALAALTRPGAAPTGEDAPVRVLPTQLVVRASSGPAPT